MDETTRFISASEKDDETINGRGLIAETSIHFISTGASARCFGDGVIFQPF